MSNVDSVKHFLRGQNLEQLGRVEEAIELYEKAVADRFDSSGPYDRLIRLYADRARHTDVVRVAEAAIATVHTYADKVGWYELMRAEALKARTKVPRAVPKGDAGPTR
ncbi:MAG: tetratricopeptide repeat protein [Actinomycetota bacterium]|nr:tetratricopeptide repeat protein [Actinomycetota bacterium]